jgi:hypothetical protein
MAQLTRTDLMSLEQYAENRKEFRAKVIAHKKNRRLPLGDHAALYFEDQLTIQYQVQEMLRIEKIFEGTAIQEELDVYNPLIPDGTNLKATFMIEYEDVEERKHALARLIGIEHKIYIKVGDTEPVNPIANEDLDRTTDDKTSSVHFMRFELGQERTDALLAGASLEIGIDHENYQAQQNLDSGPIRDALLADLTASS